METSNAFRLTSFILILSAAISGCGQKPGSSEATLAAANYAADAEEIPEQSLVDGPYQPVIEEPQTESLAADISAPMAVTEPAALSPQLYRSIASELGPKLDARFGRNFFQFTEVRNMGRIPHPSDQLPGQNIGRDSFADRIALAVEVGYNLQKPELGYLGNLFGLPTATTTAPLKEVSFLSHAQCTPTKDRLKQALQLDRRIPTDALTKQLVRWTTRMNALRTEALKGSAPARRENQRLWTKFMMCLSAEESLTTADTARSRQIASDLGIDKPPGVKFYMDAAQSNPDSRLNIGLFQFSPVSGGNVQSCLRSWNRQVKSGIYSSQIAQNSPGQPMRLLLSAHLQTFNSYCAVNKIFDSWAVQVNTKNKTNTSLANQDSQGRLKASADRCVSIFSSTNASYNHFGPFQNSTGKNLQSLMNCTLSNEAF